MIAFASQLIFVLHDCLNPTGGKLLQRPSKRMSIFESIGNLSICERVKIGGAPKSQRQVIVYAHECTILRSMTHCGSIMDSLPEVAFDHKSHHRDNEQSE